MKIKIVLREIECFLLLQTAPMNQVQSPYAVVTRSPQDQEGPKKVLEELLQGSPAPHRSHEPDMPILDTLETSPNSRKLRESLDSHEDELLEDLATFDEELTKEVDESVVNLANDLIGKIEEQDFDEDEDDARFVYFLLNWKSAVLFTSCQTGSALVDFPV